jgi:hypothetical protein
MDFKDFPFVPIAAGLNMIYDIIERVRADHGITITPENIASYVALRSGQRRQINVSLGVASVPDKDIFPDKDTFIR